MQDSLAAYCPRYEWRYLGREVSYQLIVKEPEAELANPATPAVLLGLAISKSQAPNLEEFCNLVSVALSYLSHERLQIHFVNAGCFDVLQQAFYDCCAQFDAAGADMKDVAQLKQMPITFVEVIADISSLPSASVGFPLNGPVVHRFLQWLSPSNTLLHLKTAACLALGNLARSDESSTALVEEVYQPLLHILRTAVTSKPPLPAVQPQSQETNNVTPPPPSQLLHAALSFLKNLAIPPSSKPLLGTLLEPPQSILPHLWATTDSQPQTQFAAISLARLLLVGSADNARRVCAPISPDTSSPDHARSNLHVLIELYNRVDAEPSKMEAARAVAAVCRVLHSTPVLSILPDDWRIAADAPVLPPEESGPEPTLRSDGTDGTDGTLGSLTQATTPDELRRAHFYAAHADISKPLGFLVTQRRFPVLRSEAWFLFALMSRAADGAHVILRAIEPPEACRSLIGAVYGRYDTPGADEPLVSGSGSGSGADQDAQLAAALARLQSDGAGQGGETGSRRALENVGSLQLEPQQVNTAQGPGMAKVDRENSLVLVVEILRNCAKQLPETRRDIFEEMARTGGELVFLDKEQDQEESLEKSI
jgi:hypothetical protein